MITSFRHDKQKRRERIKLLGYLILFLVIFFIFRTPITGVLSASLFKVTRPLFATEYSFKEWWREKMELAASKDELVKEIEHLRETLELVSLEAYSREELRGENEQLKSALGRKGTRALLLARVLATPGRSPYDTLLIDVGKNDKIVSGMKVYVDGDFAIGKVGQVMDDGARVTLFSSYGNEFPVTIGTSSIPGTAKGKGGGNFFVTLPGGLDVKTGDLVRIPAFEAQYAGVVSAVDKSEQSSLQDVYFAWPFNINELAWVYVVVTPESRDVFQETN